MEDALLCETDGTPMQRLCRLFGVSDKVAAKEIEYVPALDDPSRFGSGFWNLEEFLSM